jgi:hypothetical protein
VSVTVIREQEVLREAVDVLQEHLSPAKMVRLWAAWQMGEGDYLMLRDQLFRGETVDSLYEKIKAYQEQEVGESA